MSDNVVYLQFTSPKVKEETLEIVACADCRNKTFTLTRDREDHFPMLRCAACGMNTGRMGWWHDNDPQSA